MQWQNPHLARCFMSIPTPENWRGLVNELVARFGPDGKEIPQDMCPCGNRKATARRFLVARKYNVDAAEKMLRDTLVWRQTVAVGEVSGVENVLHAKPRWELLADNRKIIPSFALPLLHQAGLPSLHVASRSG